MLLEQIQLLYDGHLYDDVKTLASFALTMCDHNTELFSVMTKYQIICLQADAYFHCSQFKQSEITYRRAIQVRKLVTKGKGKSQTMDTASELDVKYRLHECYVHLKQPTDAIQVLESINPKQRCSKVNLALAELYQRAAGNDRSAVTAYKEVLRECPLSVTSIQGLLSLGVKWQEVEQIVSSALPGGAGIDWLSTWIKAHGLVANKEFMPAIATFRMLDDRPLLRDNPELVASLGEAYFFSGDYSAALLALQRVRALDPLYLHKMDLLSFLYAKNVDSQLQLEKLATSLVSVSEIAPEPWVAMGYFSLSTKKYPRAVYFAQKALSLDSRNIESLLLKGSALVELKKIPEALSHFREALRLAPHRFEAHNNLINCYLAGHRTREAIACAAEMCKQIFTCRSLTTYARILAKEAPYLEKAKSYLEKALKLDPNNFDAIYAMATILGQLQQYDSAIKLLKRHANQHSNSRLHLLIADLMMRSNDKQGAADHYSHATRMDPQSTKATEGLSRLEKPGDGLLADEVDAEGMDSSDAEDQFQRTPQDRRIPPVPDLDASASDGGDSDMNSDLGLS